MLIREKPLLSGRRGKFTGAPAPGDVPKVWRRPKRLSAAGSRMPQMAEKKVAPG